MRILRQPADRAVKALAEACKTRSHAVLNFLFLFRGSRLDTPLANTILAMQTEDILKREDHSWGQA